MDIVGPALLKMSPEGHGDEPFAEAASDEMGWYCAQDGDDNEEDEEEENAEGEEDEDVDEALALETAHEQEDEEQSEKQQAAEELESAIAGADGRVLATALQRARAACLSEAVLESARVRLSALEEDAKRAQARRVTARTLENAINGSDIKVLRSALDWAHKTGVDACVVERAQRRLSELRGAMRQERKSEVEREALARAIVSTDVEVLTSAIDSALKSGVSGPIIESARKRRLVLEQQARKRQKTARQEAAEALEIMSVGADLEALASCIEWASTTGVDEQLIALAKKRMAGLQEEASRQHIVDQATAKVKDAIEYSGVDVLDAVIEEASEKGVKQDIIQRAKKKREELIEAARREEMRKTATENLELELLGTNSESITAALNEAVHAGVKESLLRKAHKRKKYLEAKERLEQALDSADADTLAALIAHALQAGLRADRDQIINLAQAKLSALEKERIDLELAQAEGKLGMAMNGASIEDLARAYTRAVEVGVSEDLLQLARQRVAELEEEERRLVRAAASEELDMLLRDGTEEQLDAAVQRGLRSGVDGELLERASEELRRLKEERLLIAAVGGDDIAKLACAIERAEVAGVDIELLEKARARKVALEGASRKRQVSEVAARVLQAAMQTANAEGLKSAIDWAKDTGVSTADIERARKQQAVLEDAKRVKRQSQADQAVRAAARQHSSELEALREDAEQSLEVSLAAAEEDGDSTSLALAIDRAAAAGVNAEVVEEARQRMYVLEEDSGARLVAECALESAMSIADPEVLGSAIAWALRTGVHGDVLEKARQQKQALEEEEEDEEELAW